MAKAVRAIAGVGANPFYAVSDANGNFDIKGLPPGEYTVAAVHEALGEQTQKIIVGAKETKEMQFTFSSE